MNTIKKIGFSLVVIIIALIFQSILSQNGGTSSACIRLIPGAILILGLIIVWTRKNQKV